ncbi:MAG: hypothetical protein D6794_08160 [Deltaproteobacteria bacterium]|nr:MAG: hypothetical protein D6794_08160 [Deltaproteobacteria bacterium]
MTILRTIIGLMLLVLSSQAHAGGLPEYAPGEVLVKFNQSATSAQIRQLNSTIGATTIKTFRGLNIHHIRLPNGYTVKQALNYFKSSGIVQYAEPNYYRYLNAVPNDPQFPQMWGLDNTGQTGGTPNADIDAPLAWDISTGSQQVIVADLDTGLDMTHPDIAANLWTNPGEIPANGIDDDGNGYIDDVHGWDFGENDNDPSDSVVACGGHGTHTAGTIGAVGNNAVGVTGINWSVSLMPLKIFKPVFFGLLCTADSAAIIGAVNYAAMMGAKVSNNSYGGGPASQAEMDAIAASRSLYVAAAGNGGADGIGDNNDLVPQYPSSYPLDNVLAVAATDHNDVLAVFSNYGVTSVDLAAPGVQILSTVPVRDGSYALFDGTSMATPHVTGVAALMLSQDPSLTFRELRWRILNSVNPVAGLSGMVATGGRLNANNAMALGVAGPDVSVTVTPVGPTNVTRGSSLSYQVTLTNNTATAQTVSAQVYAILPNGSDYVLDGPLNVNLPPSGVVSRTFTKTVPAGAPVGAYDIIGQAQNVATFDESAAAYQIN